MEASTPAVRLALRPRRLKSPDWNMSMIRQKDSGYEDNQGEDSEEDDDDQPCCYTYALPVPAPVQVETRRSYWCRLGGRALLWLALLAGLALALMLTWWCCCVRTE